MALVGLFSLLILITVRVCGESWSFYMYGDSGLYNYDCNNDEYVFTLVTIRSEIDCARECAVNVTCKSVFYVPGTPGGTCNGYTSRYKSSDIATLSILHGSLYYASTFDFECGDSSYIFIDTKQDFASGTSLCNELGGYPVAVETEDENDCIGKGLQELNIVGPTYVGLHQPAGAGTDWIWQGTGQVMTYNGFRSPEPDKADEMCVVTESTDMSIYKWADVHCIRAEFILCEMNL